MPPNPTEWPVPSDDVLGETSITADRKDHSPCRSMVPGFFGNNLRGAGGARRLKVAMNVIKKAIRGRCSPAWRSPSAAAGYPLAETKLPAPDELFERRQPMRAGGGWRDCGHVCRGFRPDACGSRVLISPEEPPHCGDLGDHEVEIPVVGARAGPPGPKV